MKPHFIINTHPPTNGGKQKPDREGGRRRNDEVRTLNAELKADVLSFSASFRVLTSDF